MTISCAAWAGTLASAAQPSVRFPFSNERPLIVAATHWQAGPDMKATFMACSAALYSLFLIQACGRYRQTSVWTLEPSTPAEVRSSHAPIATLDRGDIAPYDGRSLADAVERLRPNWLRANPSTRINSEAVKPALYVNDVADGEISGLGTIPSESVVDVRLLSRSEAWARFGASCRCPGGAILVRTRRNE